MPTHAQLCAKLLKDAATFFRNVSDENNDVADDMLANADVFEKLAEVLLSDPEGSSGGESNAVMAGRLMQDTAKFFASLAEDNPPIREQMENNARVFTEIGRLTETDPLGVIEE